MPGMSCVPVATSDRVYRWHSGLDGVFEIRMETNQPGCVLEIYRGGDCSATPMECERSQTGNWIYNVRLSDVLAEDLFLFRVSGFQGQGTFGRLSAIWRGLRCPGAGYEDRFSPNSQCNGAPVIGNGTYTNLFLRGDYNFMESDYYSLMVGAGDTVQIALTPPEAPFWEHFDLELRQAISATETCFLPFGEQVFAGGSAPSVTFTNTTGIEMPMTLRVGRFALSSQCATL